jgi:hypothetical protein
MLRMVLLDRITGRAGWEIGQDNKIDGIDNQAERNGVGLARGPVV